MYFWKGVCLLALVASIQATEVKKCRKSSAKKLDSSQVTITNCHKSKCTLKRNTDVGITMEFVPSRDFQSLKSDIEGIIMGIPLPFPGVYGTDACPDIYDAEGAEQVGCPLKGGEKYTYKKTFRILPVYPPISLEVSCALSDGNGHAACFQVPARIR